LKKEFNLISVIAERTLSKTIEPPVSDPP